MSLKRIFTISLFLLIGLNLFGQEYMSYEPAPELDQYVGTWEWQQGDEKFQLVLVKQAKLKTILSGGRYYYADMLIGWHCYTKGGKVVNCYMNNIGGEMPNRQEARKISSSTGVYYRMDEDDKVPSYVHFIFIERNAGEKNKVGSMDLTFVPGKTNELTWDLYYFKGGDIPWGADTPEMKPFTVPREMVLKKVK